MKYHRLTSMTIPTSLQDWLGEQLEICGIDTVYTRYILSILQNDAGDHDLSGLLEQLYLQCNHKMGSKEFPLELSTKSKYKWWKSLEEDQLYGENCHCYLPLDIDEIKKAAAVECLKSASDQKIGIEKLVEELCTKLKNVHTTNDEAPMKTFEKQSQLLLEKQFSEGQQHDKYSRAFPPLGGKPEPMTQLCQQEQSYQNISTIWDGKKLIEHISQENMPSPIKNQLEDNLLCIVQSGSEAGLEDIFESFGLDDKDDFLGLFGVNNNWAPSFIIPKIKNLSVQHVPYTSTSTFPNSLNAATFYNFENKKNKEILSLSSTSNATHDSSFISKASTGAVSEATLSSSQHGGNKHESNRDLNLAQLENEADNCCNTVVEGVDGYKTEYELDGSECCEASLDQELVLELAKKFNNNVAEIWSDDSLSESEEKCLPLAETGSKSTPLSCGSNVHMNTDRYGPFVSVNSNSSIWSVYGSSMEPRNIEKFLHAYDISPGSKFDDQEESPVNYGFLEDENNSNPSSELIWSAYDNSSSSVSAESQSPNFDFQAVSQGMSNLYNLWDTNSNVASGTTNDACKDEKTWPSVFHVLPSAIVGDVRRAEVNVIVNKDVDAFCCDNSAPGQRNRNNSAQGLISFWEMAQSSESTPLKKNCTLTYHKGESRFVEVLPSPKTGNRYNFGVPQVIFPASKVLKYRSEQESPVQEGENLLISPKTHFQPIRHDSLEAEAIEDEEVQTINVPVIKPSPEKSTFKAVGFKDCIEIANQRKSSDLLSSPSSSQEELAALMSGQVPEIYAPAKFNCKETYNSTNVSKVANLTVGQDKGHENLHCAPNVEFWNKTSNNDGGQYSFSQPEYVKSIWKSQNMNKCQQNTWAQWSNADVDDSLAWNKDNIMNLVESKMFENATNVRVSESDTLDELRREIEDEEEQLLRDINNVSESELSSDEWKYDNTDDVVSDQSGQNCLLSCLLDNEVAFRMHNDFDVLPQCSLWDDYDDDQVFLDECSSDDNQIPSKYNEVDFNDQSIFAALSSRKIYYSSDLEEQWRKKSELEEKIHRKLKSFSKSFGQKKPCSFFLEGSCRRSDCKYSHDLSQITCRFWEEGSCFKGVTCPFLHGYPNNLCNSDNSKNAKDDRKFMLESEFDFPSLSNVSVVESNCKPSAPIRRISAAKHTRPKQKRNNSLLCSSPSSEFLTKDSEE